ncbi:MAG: hypothetical protein ND895_05580 [Pyrinomonadaceae bacterium]|nr:hypothetical protein [Pyrinomonadaceae bacterium]
MASVLGMLAALAFAAVVALGLGLAAFTLTSPAIMVQATSRRATAGGLPSAETIFFSIFAFCYLMWATLPLSIGSNRQFEPGRLLIYPISLRKLFALDFISEVTNLQSIFAIPAIIAMGLGAGLGSGRLGLALIATIPVIIFGVALSKWLSVSLGSLTRRRRTRGETLIALIGVVAGLGGALVGQLAPALLKHAESFRGLRWTPPGAAAVALTNGLRADATGDYLLALATLTVYTLLLIATTFWIAQRSIVGGRGKRRTASAARLTQTEVYTGWEFRLLSPQLSAVVEKELRYVMRNAQLRMMVLMPLLLIVIRLVNTNRLTPRGATSFTSDFLYYGEGLMASVGVLYVFLILSGLSCNHFAFEEGGMRSLILSPVDRRTILVGKNIALTIVALVFSTALLLVNHLVFRDLTIRGLLLVALCFITFAAIMSIIGNWLSIRFPKRMKFGKRLNVSGVAGLLIIPLLIVLAIPPLLSTAAGYLTQSLVIEYATLALFATLTVCAYMLLIDLQGQALQRREVDILEAVREPTDD